jgi:hypothetical protein
VNCNPKPKKPISPQPAQEQHVRMQPAETYPAEESYIFKNKNAWEIPVSLVPPAGEATLVSVTQPACQAEQPACGCGCGGGSGAETEMTQWTQQETAMEQEEEWPEYEPAYQQDYSLMPGYLRTNIGSLMKIEFSCGAMSGCDQMIEKTGVLCDVGADYIVLASPDGRAKICCDLNSIRFVNIMLSQPCPPPAESAPGCRTQSRCAPGCDNSGGYNSQRYGGYMAP